MTADYFASKSRDFDIMEAKMVNWNMSPPKFSLPKELVEKVNLVDCMEEDVGASKNASEGVKTQIEKREKELEISNDRAQILRQQFKEFEKLSNDLNAKLQQRADKLKAIEQRENAKKNDFDKEKNSAETYVTRAKDMLGLTIEKSPKSTVLIFTNVDKLDAKREFLCELMLDGENNKTYQSKIILHKLSIISSIFDNLCGFCRE